MGLLNFFKGKTIKETAEFDNIIDDIDNQKSTDEKEPSNFHSTSQVIHQNKMASLNIDKDTIDKILFIKAFVPQSSILLEHQSKEIIKEKLNSIKEVVVDIYNHRTTFDDIYITDELHDIRHFVEKQNLCDISLCDKERFISKLLLHLDIVRFKYVYESRFIRSIGEFTTHNITDIDWKLDALNVFITTDKEIRDSIIANNTHKLVKLEAEKKGIEKKQAEERCLAREQQEIEEAKQKLIESNRKKEIKAKAKKQLELQSKIESYELYGDILYQGKMYTVKSKTDIENFLKQINDGTI
nr:MAG TPA: hypothetical protein [Caudoviricetes sp.]